MEVVEWTCPGCMVVWKAHPATPPNTRDLDNCCKRFMMDHWDRLYPGTLTFRAWEKYCEKR